MPIKRISKPKTDAEFLEQLAFIRFVSGFRYSVVEERWSQMRKAFYNFNVSRVAAADVDMILAAKGMIRNRRKVEDVIANANLCMEMAHHYGSMLQWVAGVKKAHKKDMLLAPSLHEEFQRFKGIGLTTAGWLESLHMAKGGCLYYTVPG